MPTLSQESGGRIQMKKVIIGKSYSGDELEKLLGDTNERLFVIGNEKDAVVAVDEGNDNYQVLGVLKLDLQPKGIDVYLK